MAMANAFCETFAENSLFSRKLPVVQNRSRIFKQMFGLRSKARTISA
jgi:hypothetical protein